MLSSVATASTRRYGRPPAGAAGAGAAGTAVADVSGAAGGAAANSTGQKRAATTGCAQMVQHGEWRTWPLQCFVPEQQSFRLPLVNVCAGEASA